MKISQIPTPVLGGPSNGGGVSMRPALGIGPTGATGVTGPTGATGATGAAGGSDAATAGWVESGPLTGAALAASNEVQFEGRVVDPTDVGYDLVIVAGQSNASGYGEGYDTRLDPIHSRLWQYACSGTLIGQVCIAQDPLYHHAQAPTGRIGFSMTLGRLFADRSSENRRILIVPVAHGGSGMRPQGSGIWDPDYVPGAYTSLYANAVQRITEALALKIGTQTAPNNRIVGFFWHQGETDSFNDTYAGQYEAKFDRMVQQFKIDVPALVDAPFVVGQMVPETIPTTNSEPIVNATHVDTPRRIPGSAFVYGPTGYSQIKVGEDSVHYTGPGQRVLGRLMFDGWLRAPLNVTGVAPVAPTTVTFTQTAATTGTASWNQIEGRVTGFGVQKAVNGGAWSDVTRSATFIDITQALTGLTQGDSVQVRVRTVNEQGSSAWTTSGAVVMLAVPAQVTGLTAGTATSQTQPLSWSAAARAASYLVEYKTHAGSTWLTFTTTASLAATVTGLSASTSHDYRVTGINGAGSGTASATTTATTAAPAVFSADVGAAPQVAYSLNRRMVTGYAGPLFRVRNSTTTTETDIYCATGTDTVDLAALATAVSTNSATIKTIYDHSGNGWDFTQTTTTKQPRIASSGTLDTLNGQLAMLFDGVDDNFLDTTSGHLSIVASGGVGTICAAMKPVVKATASHFIYGEVGAAAANTTPHLSPLGASGTTTVKPLAQCRADDNSFPINTSSVNTDTSDALHTRWTVSDGLTVRQDIDTGISTAATNTSAPADNVITVTQRHLGGFGTSLAYKGYLSELVRWSTVLTEAQIASGKTNQKSYYGTP